MRKIDEVLHKTDSLHYLLPLKPLEDVEVSDPVKIFPFAQGNWEHLNRGETYQLHPNEITLESATR